MLRLAAVVLLLASLSLAQQEKKPEEQKGPPVRVNVINVCAPTEAEQKEIAAALNRIPAHPRLGADYEIARGHTTIDADTAARWVRVRRDFPAESSFANAQYSFSDDAKHMSETLVLRPRDTKEIVQVSLEDTVTGASSAASLLGTDTPPNRIKVERFGKASLGLDRCANADQSAYEPLFRKASEVMAAYRGTLGVRSLVPGELQKLMPAHKAAKTKK